MAGMPSRLVELSDGTTTVQGKVVAKDSTFCYLVDPFGSLVTLPVAKLTSFRVVAESFRPASAADFRRRLQEEFSGRYEIQHSSHYVVVGRKGKAKAFAALFEEIYRQVEAFYSVRSFTLTPPDGPLVAIVLETQDEFQEYCGRDEVLWESDLRGYYSLRSNRVVLYEAAAAIQADGLSVTSADKPSPSISESETFTADRLVPTGVDPGAGFAEIKDAERLEILLTHALGNSYSAAYNRVAGETASTIVHETTHQVGYNIGIHSRLGTNPAWVVEGLATVLEAPGMRARGRSMTRDRVNADRLRWFHNEYLPGRKSGDIARMIADDDFFRNRALDAYSVAWAFTYFLTDNPARNRKFVGYLRTLAARDATLPYSPEDRLRDFQAAFGDIARLEVEFIRALDKVEMPR